MTTCFDPAFKYTRSDNTNLRKKFKRILQEQRKKAAEAAKEEQEENFRLMELDYQQGDPYVKGRSD